MPVDSSRFIQTRLLGLIWILPRPEFLTIIRPFSFPFPVETFPCASVFLQVDNDWWSQREEFETHLARLRAAVPGCSPAPEASAEGPPDLEVWHTRFHSATFLPLSVFRRA